MSLTLQTENISERGQTWMKVWGYAQHELIYIMWVLMDVALLTPFVMGIMGWARYWSPGMVMLLAMFLMLFAFNLTRLMSALNLPPERQQLITAVALIATIIFFLRTMFHAPASILDFSWMNDFFESLNTRGDILWVQDIVLLFIIILCWARGLQLSMRDYSIDRIGLRLRIGGLILAPFLVWFGSIRLLFPITPFILLFFLAGITAVALVRAEELEQDKTDTSVSLSPRWFVSVLITALLVTGTAVVLTTIISGNTAEQVSTFFAPAVHSLQIMGTVVLATVVYLSLPFFYLLEIIINLLANVINSFIASFTVLAKLLNKLRRHERTSISWQDDEGVITNQNFDSILEQVDGVGIDVSQNWQIIIVLIVIAIVLLVALMIGRIYRNTTVAAHQAEWADDFEDGSLADEGLGKRLLHRLGFLRNWRAALSIRRIYRKMVRAAAASGHPRMEAETPFEFLQSLARIWPNHRAETELITRAYVRVRYGELPETKEELDEIREAWKRLERTKPLDAASQSKTTQPTLDKRK